MSTEVGRNYKIISRGESFLTIERRWTPAWQYCLLCLGILPGIICILVSKQWIKMTIEIRGEAAQIDLETNFKSQAQKDFDSVLYMLQSASGGGYSSGPTF